MLDCKTGKDKKIKEENRPKSFTVKINPSLQEFVVDLLYTSQIPANYNIFSNFKKFYDLTKFLINFPITKRYQTYNRFNSHLSTHFPQSKFLKCLNEFIL